MNCLNCGKELTGLQTKFCSRKCKGHYHQKQKTEKHYLESLAKIKDEWVPFDDDYYITRDGKVWSRYLQDFLKPALLKDGYCKVTLHGKHKSLHRLVAKAFIPNPKNLPQVNHIDGNKQNNTVENLEWVDARENYHHARKHGLNNHGTFLDEQTREKIREMYKTGKYTYTELENKFNICVTTLWRILDGIDHPKKQRKITEKEGYEIAKAFHDGTSSKCAVAKMFGVSDTTVGRWHKKIYGTLKR